MALYIKNYIKCGNPAVRLIARRVREVEGELMYSVDQARAMLGMGESDLAGRTDLAKVFALKFADNNSENCVVVDDTAKIAFRQPVAVFGTPGDASCLDGVTSSYDIPVKPKLLRTINNARIIGWDAVIDTEGRLYAPAPVTSDQEMEALMRETASGHYGFILRKGEGRWEALVAPTLVDETIGKTVLFMGSVEPGNYGSFIFRVLPRLLLLKEFNISYDYIIVPERTSWIMETLQMLGIDAPALTPREACGLTFKVLHKFENYDNEGLFSPSDLARLRIFAEEQTARGGMELPSKIYVSRKFVSNFRPTWHPLLNEMEIEEYMKTEGFTVVYPETIRFAEQIRLFKGASFITGPSGSGMLAACFARAGTSVLDLESYSNCVRQHAKIYCSTEKKYAFCFGTMDPADNSHILAKRWTISKELLSSSLHQLAAMDIKAAA